jgi:hypothetical protein
MTEKRNGIVDFGIPCRRWRNIVLVIAAISIMIPVPARAQAGEVASPRHPRRQNLTMDDRVQTLSKALDLNETQQAELKKILEHQRELVRRMRDDQSPAVDYTSRLRAINNNTVQQIRALLNEDQKKKYAPVQPHQTEPSTPSPTVEDWLKALTKQ